MTRSLLWPRRISTPAMVAPTPSMTSAAVKPNQRLIRSRPCHDPRQSNQVTSVTRAKVGQKFAETLSPFRWRKSPFAGSFEAPRVGLEPTTLRLTAGCSPDHFDVDLNRRLRAHLVELREERHELPVRLLALLDQVRSQPAIEVDVEMVGRDLGQDPDELRVGDAASERVALEPLAGVDEPRRGERARARRATRGTQLNGQAEAVVREPPRVVSLRRF